MNYNELLNKLSSSMANNNTKKLNTEKKINNTVNSKTDNVADLLNKIGLEVQRRGGY